MHRLANAVEYFATVTGRAAELITEVVRKWDLAGLRHRLRRMRHPERSRKSLSAIVLPESMCKMAVS